MLWLRKEVGSSTTVLSQEPPRRTFSEPVSGPWGLIDDIASSTAAILSGMIIYGTLINLLNIKEVSTLHNKLLSILPKK